MIRRILVMTFFVLMACNLFAQGKVVFEQKALNLGKVEEKDSIIHFSFHFKNQGASSVKIKNVKAPCGCIKPIWDNKMYAPGDTGSITVTYQVYNRPGPIYETERIKYRTLTVYTNGSPAVSNLTFTGFVKPNVQQNVKRDFSKQLGSLRMETNWLDLKGMTTGDTVHRTFPYYNDSDEITTIEVDTILDYLLLKSIPKEIKPHAYGTFEVTYIPTLKNDYGYIKDTLSIRVNQTPHELYFYGSIRESFPVVIDTSKVARLEISKTKHDFEYLNSNTKARFSIELTNSGYDTLYVRKVFANCSYIQAEKLPEFILPNKSHSIDIVFNTKGREGRYSKNVTILVNDPLKPKRIIQVKARVR